MANGVKAFAIAMLLGLVAFSGSQGSAQHTAVAAE